jgi:hypothetical protein
MMEKLKIEATGMVEQITSGLSVRDVKFTTNDGNEVALRIYTPEDRTTSGPSLL